MRTAITILLILTTIRAVASAAPDSPEALAAIAVRNNPEVGVLQKQLSMLKEQTAASNIWSDPVLSVSYSSMTFSSPFPGGHPMSGVQAGISQKLPFPGKNAARVKASRAYEKTHRARIGRWKTEIRALVKKLYWNITAARQLQSNIRKHIALVRELSDSVNARYETGHRGQGELIQLSILENRLMNQADLYKEKEIIAVSAINSALNRDMGNTVTTPNSFPAADNCPGINTLMKYATAHNPALIILRRKENRAAAESRLADLEKMPDFTVSAGYRFRLESGKDPGDDMFSVSLSVPLPFDFSDRFSHRKAASEQQRISLKMAEKSRLNTIALLLRKNLASRHRSRKLIRRFKKKILPEAHRSLVSAHISFEAGEQSFESLYEAGVRLITASRNLIIQQKDAMISVVNIDTLIGFEPSEKNNNGGICRE